MAAKKAGKPPPPKQQTGLSPEEIDLRVKKAIERTPRGQFIQLNGQWLQK